MNIYNQMGKFAKDECYTTTNEANKLVNWLTDHGIISKSTAVWCPFDTELSAIYRELTKGGVRSYYQTSNKVMTFTDMNQKNRMTSLFLIRHFREEQS